MTTVFDPASPVRADRAVSVREFSRSAGSVIDAIERDGEIVALSRHGRIVALVTPLPERTLVRIEGPGLPSRKTEEEPLPAVRNEWLEMGPVANDLLVSAESTYPLTFSMDGTPHHPSKVAVACTHLERAGLVEADFRGRRLTPEGLATARALKARLDSEAGAPPSLKQP